MSQSSGVLPQLGFSLPLLGENHPLRKKFTRTFVLSAVYAMLIVGGAAVGRIIAVNLAKKEDGGEKVVRFVSIEQVVPPSISQDEAPPQVNLAAQVAAPSIGVPEPVPDYQAQELTAATIEEISEFQTSDLSALTGGGDSLAIDFSAGMPSEDEYVAVEEMPVLINPVTPEYPDMARSAGIEGTVVLKMLVGKDGSVQEVKVVEGPELLHESAKEAGRKFKFKPALQQNRPVAVWVQIPMKFSLSS